VFGGELKAAAVHNGHEGGTRGAMPTLSGLWPASPHSWVSIQHQGGCSPTATLYLAQVTSAPAIRGNINGREAMQAGKAGRRHSWCGHPVETYQEQRSGADGWCLDARLVTGIKASLKPGAR